MKLAFYTASMADIEKAARLGFDGVALSAAAFGTADVGTLDDDAIAHARRLCVKHGMTITALTFYDMAGDPPAADAVTPTFERVFDAAERLDVRVIGTFSGFDPDRDWDGNVQLFADRFGPVAERAERRGLRVALENWIGFWGRLPFRPMNMGGSPDTWDAMFEAVPSPALGLEFDPSHLFWQGIDHIRALKEYRDRVYHVHAKDVEILPERRYRGGINGDYYRFRIPGYGAIDWTGFISTLDELGYTDNVTIEHEDVVYGYGSGGDEFDAGLVRGWQVLNPLIHPTTTRR